MGPGWFVEACLAIEGGHGGCGWPFPCPRHRRRHPRLVQTAGKGDTPWEQLSVLELRALLRDYPIDRTSLPAPIENLRRAELVEALRQLGALGYGDRP